MRAPEPLPLVTEPADMGRNCLFGCGALVLAVVIIIAVALLVGYLMARRMVEQYTGPAARDLPAIVVDETRLAELHARLADFASGLDASDGPATIALAADDINQLLAADPAFGGEKRWIHVSIEGDTLRGEVAIPLSFLEVKVFDLAGRYLNGSATLDLDIESGQPALHITALEAGGTALPEEIMNGIRAQNLAARMTLDAETRRFVERLDSVAVRDGQVVLTRKEP